MDESLKLQELLICLFCSLINRHHSSWVVRFFGCCYFKSCRCWTWHGSDTHSRCNMKWYRLQCMPPYLSICFYWHLAWQHLNWPKFTVVAPVWTIIFLYIIYIYLYAQILTALIYEDFICKNNYSCFIVLVSCILKLLFNLIKITQLQFDWD